MAVDLIISVVKLTSDGLLYVNATVPGVMIPIICATAIVGFLAFGTYCVLKFLKHEKTL